MRIQLIPPLRRNVEYDNNGYRKAYTVINPAFGFDSRKLHHARDKKPRLPPIMREEVALMR